MTKYMLTLNDSLLLLNSEKEPHELVPQMPPDSDILFFCPELNSDTEEEVAKLDCEILEVIHRRYILMRIRKGIEHFFLKDSTVIMNGKISKLCKKLDDTIQEATDEVFYAIKKTYPTLANGKTVLFRKGNVIAKLVSE